MATGDISAVTIRATGWDADVTILGFTTATTYNYTDPTTGTNKFRLTVTSTGYGSDKSVGAPSRTVYGTAIVRKAYPNNAQLDETTSGSDVIVRLALSSRIRTGDTVVLNADAGAFTQGGSSNAATNLSCTNSSGLAHPAAFAQWAQRPFDRWQTSPTLGVTARHMHGIAAVDILVTDTHGGASVNPCTKVSRLRAATGLYAEQWEATINLSDFTQGDVLTARFKVYPIIGDAITDSNSNAITADNNTLGICNYTYYCDKNATADVYAVVSSTGNDATAVSSATLATAAASPYLTIGKALTIGTANIIYLRSGAVYNVLGSAVTAPSSFGYWRQVKVYPGDSATTVELTGTAAYNTPHLSYEGLTYRLNTGHQWFDGATGARYLSFKDCTMDANGKADNGTVSGFGYRSACVYFSGCTWVDASKFGFSDNFGARVCHWFDGCDLSSLVEIGCNAVWRLVACKLQKFTVNSKDTGTSTGPQCDPWFVEFNKLVNNGNSSACFKAFAGSVNNSSGLSFVGNVIERASGTSPNIQISADSSTSTMGHVVFWNNTVAGERTNLFYNDTGVTAYLKSNVSVMFNAFGGSPTSGAYNIKSDTFGTPSGNRIGNWSELYGVDYVGNAESKTVGFNNAFVGLGSASTMDTAGEGNSNAAVCTMAFTSDKSVTGTGVGNGDYTPGTGSALLNLIPSGYRVLGWDLTGRAFDNAGRGTAGAYQEYISSSGGTASVDLFTKHIGFGKMAFAEGSNENLILSSAIDSGLTISSRKFVLCGIPLTLFENDSSTFSIGVYVLPSSGADLDETDLDDGIKTLVFEGQRLEIKHRTNGGHVLKVSEDADTVYAGYVRWCGERIAVNENNSLIMNSVSGTIDSIGQLFLGGMPLLYVEIDGRKYLAVSSA